MIDWLGPLDSTQHAHGVGSPEAKDALRRIDESIARTISKIEALGRLGRTDIIVTSDHGFAHHNEGVDLVGRLVAAGLKADRTSTDLVVASQSQSLLFYLPPANVEPLVRFLQREPSVDVIFTRGGSGGRGSVSGTFSLDLIGADHRSRAADVIATLVVDIGSQSARHFRRSDRQRHHDGTARRRGERARGPEPVGRP